MQKKIVLRTTGMVAAGVLAASAVMVGVYAILDKFTAAVLLGAVLGSLYAVFNFYMRSTAQVKALEKDSPMQAKQAASLSYTLRMLGMIVLAVVGFATDWYDGVTFLLPQIFAQAVTWIYYFVMVKKEARAAAASSGEEPDEEAEDNGPCEEEEVQEQDG